MRTTPRRPPMQEESEDRVMSAMSVRLNGVLAGLVASLLLTGLTMTMAVEPAAPASDKGASPMPTDPADEASQDAAQDSTQDAALGGRLPDDQLPEASPL